MGCNVADSRRRFTNTTADHIFAVFSVDSYSGPYTLKLQGLTLDEMEYFCHNKWRNISEKGILQSYALRTSYFT
jgi:hypothetical protein